MVIPITDDCIVEYNGETFNVHMMDTPGLDDRLMHTTVPAVVNITDDDGRNSELRSIQKSVSIFFVFLLGITVCLEQTSYTAVKADESVDVCIVVTPDGCSTAFPFMIRFKTLNDSAGA